MSKKKKKKEARKRMDQLHARVKQRRKDKKRAVARASAIGSVGDAMSRALRHMSPAQVIALATLAADVGDSVASRKDPKRRLREALDPDDPVIEKGVEFAKTLGVPALTAALGLGEAVLRSIPLPATEAEIAYKTTALGLGVARLFFSPDKTKVADA